MRNADEGFKKVLEDEQGTFAFIHEASQVCCCFYGLELCLVFDAFKLLTKLFDVQASTIFFKQIRYEYYNNCNFTEIGDPFAEQPYAVAVQQGSHLQEEISRVILELQKDRYFETLSGITAEWK